MVSAAARVGDRPVHAFWPMLRPSFRWVLLEPHRRASGDSISWAWRADRAPSSPSHADLCALRQRLGDALVDLAAELDRRAADSGASMELYPVIESTVRTLIRASEAQLSVYAVSTESGWMIRSWGFSIPAKAVCAAGAADEVEPQETAAATKEDVKYLEHPPKLRHRRRWVALMVTCVVLIGGAAMLFLRSENNDTRATIKPPSARETASIVPDRDQVAEENGPVATIRATAMKDQPPSVASRINPTASLKGLSRTFTGSVVSGAGFSSASAPLAQSESAFGELSADSAAPVGGSAPERAIPVAGRDDGRETATHGAPPPGAATDVPRHRPDATLIAASNKHAQPPSATLHGNTDTRSPIIPFPSALAGAAPFPAPTFQEVIGLQAKPATPPSPSPSLKKPKANSQVSPVVRNATPNAGVAPDQPASDLTANSASALLPVEAQTSDDATNQLYATNSERSRPAKLKSPVSNKGAPDQFSDETSTPNMGVVNLANESFDEPAKTPVEPAALLLTRGQRINDQAPDGSFHETMRLGDWKVVRVRDVVLATWPAVQGSRRTLRAAREQAWAQMEAAVPASFREPRVRMGWSLRLSPSALIAGPPVWRDAASGQPLNDTVINNDVIRLGLGGPSVEKDARLIGTDGREIARLIVSERNRIFDITTTTEVRSSAPWFSVAIEPADKRSGSFAWKSLRPDTWSDRSWAHGREGRNLEVSCYPAVARLVYPIRGALGVVDPTSGWALSCAITLQSAEK
ncbi:hypothetical protein RAHE111665_04475 [Rariglobus hedericola]